MRHLVTLRDFEKDPFRLFNDVERDMRRLFGTTNSKTYSNFTPSCEFRDKETHYLLSYDLPGIPKEDINIEVKEGQLFVSGERKFEAKEADYTEKRYGKFQRVIKLPQEVEEDKIEAHFENGVLTVALPKAEKSSPKQISISESKKEGIWNKLLGATEKEENKTTVEIKSDGNDAA